jgi:hypothetical protein
MNAHPGRHVVIAGEGIPEVVDTRPNEKTFVRVARQIEFGPSGKVDTRHSKRPRQIRESLIARI